jgi:hypothetical protein
VRDFGSPADRQLPPQLEPELLDEEQELDEPESWLA